MQSKMVAHALADRVWSRAGNTIQGKRNLRKNAKRRALEIQLRTQVQDPMIQHCHQQRQLEASGLVAYVIYSGCRVRQGCQVAALELH